MCQWHSPMTTSLCGSRGLSARRARRTKSRGPKGLQIEVGARRAPRLLVLLYVLYYKRSWDPIPSTKSINLDVTISPTICNIKCIKRIFGTLTQPIKYPVLMDCQLCYALFLREGKEGKPWRLFGLSWVWRKQHCRLIHSCHGGTQPKLAII